MTRAFDVIADRIGDTSAAGDVINDLQAHGFQIVSEWKCSGCGIASPNRVRSCECPTGAVRRSNGEGAWKIEPNIAALVETIQTRLLGIRPDDQDVVLEDDDWRLILTALGAPALTGDGQ